MLPFRPGTRRALAQPFVERAVREGLSSSQITTALKAGDLGYRRQELLADMRFYGARRSRIPALRSVPLSLAPTENLMTAATRHQSRRYLYTVELEVRNVRTDELTPFYRQISTDTRISRQEAIATAVENLPYDVIRDDETLHGADLYAVDLDVTQD